MLNKTKNNQLLNQKKKLLFYPEDQRSNSLKLQIKEIHQQIKNMHKLKGTIINIMI